MMVNILTGTSWIDFLAVPFIPFFDDEYWSETAAIYKLDLIYILLNHPQLFLLEFFKSNQIPIPENNINTE